MESPMREPNASFATGGEARGMRLAIASHAALRRMSVGGGGGAAGEEGSLSMAAAAAAASSGGGGSARRDKAAHTAPNWSRFVNSKGDFINRQDLEVIQQYEKQPNETVQEWLDTEAINTGSRYATALMKVLRNITEVKVTEYALELLEEFLTPDLANRLPYFYGEGGQAPDLNPLIRNLSNETSLYVREESSYLIALFLSVRMEPREAVEEYMTWACEQLRAHKNNSNHTTLRAVLFSLSTLLANPDARRSFLRHGGIRLVAPFASRATSKNTQTVYECSLILWEMSMLTEALPEYQLPLLRDLVQLLIDKPREKITRVALATLRTVVSLQPERQKELGEALQTTELLRALGDMNETRITDPDMLLDVTYLKDFAEQNFKILTSFDRYRQEVIGGRLKWGVMHKEAFWKESVKSTEKDDFLVIQKLVAIVKGELFPTTVPEEGDDDSLSIAVACSDLGYFIQYYPTGKQILISLGAKPAIMKLLEHESAEVRKYALVCMSKMLVSQWEFIGAAAKTGGSGGGE